MADHQSHGGQPLSQFPNPTVYITGHDLRNGNSILKDARPVQWVSYNNDTHRMASVYTTDTFPPDLNEDRDLISHDRRIRETNGHMGLVVGGGTVLRYVDIAPDGVEGNDVIMHRTQSLDYGIIIEGKILSVLDGGETHLLQRGDIMVQRGTTHAWKNGSTTEWARIVFVLQDCKPLIVLGQRLQEDLGNASDTLPASRNDVISS